MAITETNGATRVVADLGIVTNPNSGFEQVTPMNNSQSAIEFQSILNGIATQIAVDTPPPAPGAAARVYKSRP
jgi:hypothetical protein